MASRVRFIPAQMDMSRSSASKGKAMSGSGGGPGFSQPIPTVELSAREIDEGSAADTVVGVFAYTPPGTVLSLFDSAGGRFKITESGGVYTLKAAAVATDWAVDEAHVIVVRTAIYGIPTDHNFTIDVISADVEDITIPGDTVEDASAEDVVVSSLVSDPTGATFTLEDDAGGKFKVVGTNILTTDDPVDIADVEYDITVRATRGTKTFDKPHTITVEEAA